MDRNSVATMRLQFEPARPSAKPLVIVNAFIERVNDSDSPTDVYHVRVMKGDVIRDFWQIPYLTAALLLMAAEVDNLYNERD